MKLAEKLFRYFNESTRAQGLEYVNDGRVTFKEINGGSALFNVRGTQPYEVSLRYERASSAFDLSCSCPNFAEGSHCKHLWASVLDSDQRNLFPDLTSDENEAALRPHWRDFVRHAQQKVGKDQRVSTVGKPALVINTSPRIGSYAIDVQNRSLQDQIQLQLFAQERLKNGELGVQRAAELTADKIQFYEDPLEREFLWDLIGRTEVISPYSNYTPPVSRISKVALGAKHAPIILQKISDAEKLFILKPSANRSYGSFDKQELEPLVYDSKIWKFQLVLDKVSADYQLRGELVSGEAVRSLDDVSQVIGSFVFFNDFMASSDLKQHAVWFEVVKAKPLFLASTELEAFLDYFWLQTGARVPLILPDEIEMNERRDVIPVPRVRFEADRSSGRFALHVEFEYLGRVADADSGAFIYNIAAREKVFRNREIENSFLQQLDELRLAPSEVPGIHGYIAEEDFIATVGKLMTRGWQVLAQDQKVRSSSNFKINVHSGMDWFDIQSEIQFGEETLQLPQLLQALKNGQRTVTLGDGSLGILPEDWLRQMAPFSGIGKVTKDGVRLTQIQALFFSVGLENNHALREDKKFQSLRKIVSDLQNLKEPKANRLLKGTLREYQKTGVAWLTSLSEHQLGGVLADDMGLGKTIQVLAMLASPEAKSDLPTLVVAPKSLIFNWKNEAEKFTPHLKVMAYTGPARHRLWAEISKQNVVLTTYQTLRKDIEAFQKQKFQFLILDEAHYIKNSQSQITIATKLVQAEKKFALTGTPVENSLMDLFSILSVVIPGLVSDSQAQRWVKETNPEMLRGLASSLKPFLMRRTKEQVLKDLPAKTEQILYCELSPDERKKYDDLKAFYWGQLSDKIKEKGLARSKIDVLEALLRLRQAACHPGLLDRKFVESTSAKFELVLEQIHAVIRDGHKALVFSQFTSLLTLFKKHLTGVNFEYLDGKTTDRAERVENFQTNKDCQIFLLSLKAGGVGLNLTAADYVFILDPWWNPAAESQAIDRAHRIGQDKKVFAYKIIAKDTIEEKILALQEKKKNIAKAVISDEAGVLRDLKMDDLRELFE